MNQTFQGSKNYLQMTEQLYLQAIEPAKNKSRFYKLLIQPDLWGGVSLVREYGRISQPGTVILNWYEKELDVLESMKRLSQIKCKRGYQ